MNSFPFYEPRFWEIVATIIVVIFSLPFVYISFIMYSIFREFLSEKITLWRRPSFTIHDPFFGKITFNPLLNSWSSTGSCNSHTDVDEIIIEANESGPTDAQRTLYQEIEKRFPNFWEEDIVPTLRKELVSFVKESNQHVPEFNLPEKEWDFSMFHLYLSKQIEPTIWELSCSTELDNECSAICNVSVTNWKITNIEIDHIH